MALIKIVIFDTDDEYSFNLCNSLTHSFSDKFVVNYCNNSDNTSEYIKQINPDIVLTDENNYLALRNFFKRQIIMLTTGVFSLEYENVLCINKYQEVYKIASEIINCFANSGKLIKTNKEKSAKVIAIYSAVGSSGKTTVARGMCSIFALAGSTFYLNFEQFQTTKFFLPSNTDYSMSDIIYYVKQRDKNFVTRLSSLRCQDYESNVYFFKEVNNSLEINELLPEDIEFLIESIKNSGIYDFIVIDMDSRFDESTLRIMQETDKLLLLLIDDEISLHKTSLFTENLKNLSDSGYEQANNILDKITYSWNKAPQQEYHSPNIYKLTEKPVSCIRFCNNIISKSQKFTLIGGPDQLYEDIKNVADRFI